MIGRFPGSISLGNNKSKGVMCLKMALSAIIIYGLISGIVISENTQSGDKYSVVSTWPYLGFIIGKSRAARTLSIKDLGQNMSQGPSLLVIKILSGVLVLLAPGWFADMIGNYQASFFIPIICYIYIAFYGLKVHIPAYKKG